MSKPKHTPGPWIWVGDDIKTKARCHTTHYYLDRDRKNREPMAAGGSLVSKPAWDAREDGDWVQEIIQTDSGVYGPHGPDRDLIAAAPELYDALEDLLLAASIDAVALSHQAELDAAVAALAKARGEKGDERC